MGRERMEGLRKVITAFKSTWEIIQPLNRVATPVLYENTDSPYSQ